MPSDETEKFLKELANDLNSRNISLPSFPDVVIRIRSELEDPTCTADQLAGVARTDPVLVSRLLVAANSAFHNRAGIRIVDLNLAVSRLGFEAVRNAAIALAVEQIFRSSRHPDLREPLRDLWSRSISLSSMCYVLASGQEAVSEDSAFLCGLLHDIGKLYILQKAKDFPRLLGDRESLQKVLAEWHPGIGRSIVESWEFPPEIADTINLADVWHDRGSKKASMIDVVYTAVALIDSPDEMLGEDPLHPAIGRVIGNAAQFDTIRETYARHLQSIRQAVGG